MRPRKFSFEELVDKNKQELLSDRQAINEIEEQIDKKHENLIKHSNVKYVN